MSSLSRRVGTSTMQTTMFQTADTMTNTKSMRNKRTGMKILNNQSNTLETNVSNARRTIYLISKLNEQTLNKDILIPKSTKRQQISKPQIQVSSEQTNDLNELQMIQKIQRRPMTPNKTGRNAGSLSRNQLTVQSKRKCLLNQNVIDSENFRMFLEFKNSKNDFRKPNQTFQQQLGQLNPFSIDKAPNTLRIDNFFKKQQKPVEKLDSMKPIDKAIFDIPLWDTKRKAQALKQLKDKQHELKYSQYKSKVKTINEIKDYLWENKNTLGREQIMRMAILIDRMDGNIKKLERQQKLVNGNDNEDVFHFLKLEDVQQ